MEYPNNSHKFKEESSLDARKPETAKKEVEKVISGKATLKKETGIRKYFGGFVSNQTGDIKGSIISEVLIPGIQKIIYAAVTTFLESIFPGVGPGKKTSTPSSKVSYSSYYARDNDQKPSYNSSRVNNYEDVIVEDRREAESVLERMDELISVYGVVSVADYYDLLGLSHNYTDDNYGWTDIHSAMVTKVRDGYLIRLPRAIPISNM